MAHFKKITSALSIATTVLLQACGSTGSDSAAAPAPVANNVAPQLVATWQTDCIITQNSSSSTTTQASGGSGGGGGVSGGAAYRKTAVFKQDGGVEFSTENFATSNCNANTLSAYGRYDAVYFVGEAGLANDGSPVTEFSYSDSTTTTYSIFQIVNSVTLYLGDGAASTAGNDGASITTRLDGLGPKFSKK
jgi:hypothetical protein